MLPTQINYPQFVPDQLLTSEHLNQLFGYLEEQDRLTRTNLIGIGIACGLEVRINAAGTEVTITKGCGVTSEGYLVAIPETTYTSSKPYNAIQERIYDRFADAGKNQRFPIDELKQAAVEEGTSPLSLAGLSDKVVLLFVEILEEGAKNCNPNSCDDKGVHVTVTFRPLLIDRKDADSMNKDQALPKAIHNLADIKMRRYDVKATNLPDTAAVFEAYREVLNAAFLKRTEEVLSKCYAIFKPFLADLYTSDPFAGLAGNFKFLHEGMMSPEQLLNLQYYYDLFSDLLLSYGELKKNGSELLGICCPDHNLFPRHLFLDLILSDAGNSTGNYRQNFIPSPILQGNSASLNELRSLFTRLVLLLKKFFIPPVIIPGKSLSRKPAADENIRITPSQYGDVPLSDKAIPFYYQVTDGPVKLLDHWNFKKSAAGSQDKNLSYYAATYNAADDEVIRPLLYDPEPGNFLRIEGHLGKPYTHVLRNILLQKQQYRLPFEVIALGTDMAGLPSEIRKLADRTTVSGLSQQFAAAQDLPQCRFRDLESLYDTLASELTCSLCKEIKYFYDLPGNDKLPNPDSLVPQAGLLKKCDPDFRFKANTQGHEFEQFYKSIKDQTYISANVFFGTFNAVRAANLSNDKLSLMLLYYIQKLSETISADLSSFDLAGFNSRYNDLLQVASYIKTILRSQNSTTGNVALAEDITDHLDALIFACKQAQFTTLYKDYLSRWVSVVTLQKFGNFLKMHPGIQHKAGVTIGGTFILVYHQAAEDENDEINLNPGAAVGKDYIAQTEFLRGIVSGTGTKAASILTKASETEKKTAGKIDALTAAQLEKIMARPAGVNPGIADLIDELSDGTVIADFFLPYLCYSDCPPIHFILGNEMEPEEKVSIEIEQKEYCSNDKTSFPVRVSPEGGVVTGEGIKSGNKKNVSFSPSGVDMQGNKFKKLILSYTKGEKSASVELIVYQSPTATFTVSRGRIFNQVTFKGTSDFADTFAWDFGDGQKSTDKDPVHTYQEEGSYAVSLVATNGICSSAPHTETVSIIKPAQKNCFSLVDIIKEFNHLKESDEQFRILTRVLALYPKIEEFMKALEAVQQKPVGDQLEFFSNADAPGFMQEALAELFRFATNSDVIVPALALYRVLVKLTMYIQCIQQPADLDKAKVNLGRVFRLMQSHIKSLGALAQQSPDIYKATAEELQKAFKEELERIDEQSRPVYHKLISGLITMLR